MTKKFEQHLKVYMDRSELVVSPERIDIFNEGKIDAATIIRTKKIKEQFKLGFLDNRIASLKKNGLIDGLDEFDDECKKHISELVNSITSEVGRAIVGLTVMQLCIKNISPEQNIRLHKGSANSKQFSWISGVSMRVLDKNFVTPTLRQHNLLKLNADGFMMTRSLAENYPYSFAYKANIKGARIQWIKIVEAIENNEVDPSIALDYLLSLLMNHADDFELSAVATILLCKEFVETHSSKEIIFKIITSHVNNSNYAARLMEVSMHSLMQAVLESGCQGDSELKPLSQMRSANKKHGNIGDIEILENNEITKSWDAKYGKSYLRDEIEELADKLPAHDKIELAGFVTTDTPKINAEILTRIDEINQLYNTEITIRTYEEWVEEQFEECIKVGLTSEESLASSWLIAYSESLGQKRREIAPIDEPCSAWISELNIIISENM